MTQWKDIPNLNGRYQASMNGEIRSTYRYRKILKATKTLNGYMQVCISFGKGKHKSLSVHRLIASTFIPNPKKLPCINHIDGNKENNAVENLEWVTWSDNIKHAFRVLHKKANKPRLGKYGKECYNHRSIEIQNMNGYIIEKYDSIADAVRSTGISHHKIWRMLNGLRQDERGYKWIYKD